MEDTSGIVGPQELRERPVPGALAESMRHVRTRRLLPRPDLSLQHRGLDLKRLPQAQVMSA